MSNLWLNIRVLFWHLKCTLDGHMSISYNRWHMKRFKSYLMPILFYDLDLSNIKISSFGKVRNLENAKSLK